MPAGEISDLFHYPIKGLSAQRLDRVTLSQGCGFPDDRMFGFARYNSGFDPENPEPMPKDRFLMLMRNARLAGLQSHLDPATRRLTLKVQGRQVHEADLGSDDGCRATESFFARMFDLPPSEMPRFVHAAPHRFTDVSVVSTALMNAISLINLDSVRDLGTRIGADVDPARFRANVYFEGWPPFCELALEGQQIRIGDARAVVTLRTRRCAATEVNPVTARRDLSVPRLLMQHYGHADMGVYAELLEDTVIVPGAKISIEGGK